MAHLWHCLRQDQHRIFSQKASRTHFSVFLDFGSFGICSIRVGCFFCYFAFFHLKYLKYAVFLQWGVCVFFSLFLKKATIQSLLWDVSALIILSCLVWNCSAMSPVPNERIQETVQSLCPFIRPLAVHPSVHPSQTHGSISLILFIVEL